MLMRHEIVQVPSATILGAMRALTAGRARPSKTAAIFADPIFDAQDPRVQRAGRGGPRHRGTATGRQSPRLALTRLPFSRSEADAIGRWSPKRVTTFLGAEATRERALAGRSTTIGSSTLRPTGHPSGGLEPLEPRPLVGRRGGRAATDS